ncbi:hypothetical protein BGX29_011778 [Mortierella sp. GBA35]|nr:hypothetical protein BGX29_011778 [Mortierella sp. GBA35]
MNSLHSAPSLLDIPELVLALTGHLTRYDLTVCIRVNRAWFAAFIPRLWENVHVKDFDYFRQPKSRNSRRRHEHPVGSEPEPTLSVRKYGHLIRSLSVRSELALRQLGPSLTSLRLLDLTTLVNCGRCFEDDRMRPERQTLREGHDGHGSIAILCSIFGQNVATLTTVRLSLLNHGDTIVLIDALRQISSLEELTIFDSALFVRREHYLATLVEVCRPTTNLKRLAYCRGRDSGDNHGFPAVSSTRRNQEQDTLTRTSIDDDGTGLGKRSSRGIQQLRLTIPHGTGRDDLFRIFQSCGRELQSLSFGSFPREKIVFLRDILQDSCSNLRYLSFRTSVANPLDRELWMDLLNNCPPLEVLVIYNGIHARSLVDVLKRRHAESLLEIHLYRQECEYEQSDLLEILEFSRGADEDLLG